MSACRGFRELISGRLEGALDPEQEARLQAHLARCPDCVQALEELGRTLALLKDLPEVEPPPWLEARILARARTPAPPVRSRWTGRPGLAAAAGLMLCLTGYLVLRVANRHGEEGAPLPAVGKPVVQAAPETGAPASPTPAGVAAAAPQASPQPEFRAKAAAPSTRPQPAPPAATLPAPPPAAAAAAQPVRTEALPPVQAEAAPEGSRTRLEAQADAAAPAGPRLAARSGAAAAKVQQPLVLTLRLHPRDPAGAAGQVAEALRAAGAVPFEAPSQAGPHLGGRVPTKALGQLLDRLEALGSLEGAAPRPAPEGDTVAVTVTW
jgi:hypothetical protein